MGFAVATTFLLINGLRLTASEPDAFEIFSGVADGRYSEDEIGAWIRVCQREIHAVRVQDERG